MTRICKILAHSVTSPARCTVREENDIKVEEMHQIHSTYENVQRTSVYPITLNASLCHNAANIILLCAHHTYSIWRTSSLHDVTTHKLHWLISYIYTLATQYSYNTVHI